MSIAKRGVKRLVRTRSSTRSSVPPSPLLPNGDVEGVTEEAKEQIVGELLDRRELGKISRNVLYRDLRKVLGNEEFESLRNSHDNIKQRVKERPDPLDPRFRTFSGFLRHMGLRQSPDLSVDRIDNSKGYFPDNCRWADKVTQSNNRSNTVTLDDGEEVRPLTEWARLRGVPASLLRSRKARGWSDYDVINGRQGDHSPKQDIRKLLPPGERNYQAFMQGFLNDGGSTYHDQVKYLVEITREKRDRIDFKLNQIAYDPSDESIHLSEEERKIFEYESRHLARVEECFANAVSELKRLEGSHYTPPRPSNKYVLTSAEMRDDGDLPPRLRIRQRQCLGECIFCPRRGDCKKRKPG